MPAKIVDLLNREINAGLQARFDDLGLRAYATSPAEFGKFIVEETEKWAKVVKAAGIKPI